MSAAPGSEIAVDGQAAGTAPLRRTIPVDPGSHQVTARVPGAPIGHVGSVAIAAGETATWEAQAAPPPLPDGPVQVLPAAPSAAVSATPVPPPRERNWLPWAAGGAVLVAGAVVTAILLSRAPSNPGGSLGSVDGRTPH